MLAGVDIGNTSIKVALFENEDLKSDLVGLASVEEAIAFCSRNDAKAAYCTTRELDADTKGMLAGAGWWELTTRRHLPLTLEYKTPDTLGADRVAAAIGASVYAPGESLLVVDAGTALTLDVVSDGKSFLGGNISPGMKMRMNSLHEDTSRLPEVQIWGNLPGFGYDTETAIRAGVVRGIANEIAGTFRVAEEKYGCTKIIITGGDARFLMEPLAEATREMVDIHLYPALVELGLTVAYRYDHDKEK